MILNENKFTDFIKDIKSKISSAFNKTLLKVMGINNTKGIAELENELTRYIYERLHRVDGDIESFNPILKNKIYNAFSSESEDIINGLCEFAASIIAPVCGSNLSTCLSPVLVKLRNIHPISAAKIDQKNKADMQQSILAIGKYANKDTIINIDGYDEQALIEINKAIKNYGGLNKLLELVANIANEFDYFENLLNDDDWILTASIYYKTPEKEYDQLSGDQDKEEAPKDECYKKEFAEDLNDKEYFDAMYKAYKELTKRKTAYAAVYGYSKEGKFVPVVAVKNNQKELTDFVNALRTKPKGQTDVTVYTIYKDRLDNIEDVLKEQGYIKEVKEEINKDVKVKIGDVIHINHLQGEDTSKDGKEGIVKAIDDIGQLHGTWDSVAVIPGVDDFEVIKPEITEDIQDENSVIKPTIKINSGDTDADILNTIASW